MIRRCWVHVLSVPLLVTLVVVAMLCLRQQEPVLAQKSAGDRKAANQQREVPDRKSGNPTQPSARPEDRVAQLLEQLYNGQSDQVMVAAHRGDWRNAPENSLRAVQNCITMGVDIVEIDIRLTRDGQLVVLHDKTLDRTTTGQGAVSDKTLKQLKKLRLKNGYGLATDHPIPTLEEVLRVARGKVLIYLDKSEGLFPRAFALAQRTGTARQVLFYGHAPPEQIRLLHQQAHPKPHYLPKLDERTPNRSAYILGFLNQVKAPALIVSFSQEESDLVPLMRTLRQKGLRVWVSPLWPELCGGHTDDRAVDQPDRHWGWLIQRGANILCTDRPAALLAYLRDHGLHD